MKEYQALGKKLHALAGDVSFLTEKKITGIKSHESQKSSVLFH